ncbi:methyl-accepting chemotaxis protein [Sporomusa sp. KB1]|jgi:methyl-accepting chemotaxis protein|uniref:HAMP domain-containing methyl-accepting chemotaxis protein n=1 Tax=Sporomusa sp. KB1 TaxID=943346 RepID=UPI0011A1060D|nr:methyl-accepting chemotaxis protein [Sporomusa sp. KB1]TWH49459.1 methyl-accepting chemotaxis protein [Sporomusa sp. KB1]
MAWFHNLNIAKKLLFSFVFVSMIAGAVGVFGIHNLYSITAEDKKLYDLYTVPLGDLLDITENYYIMQNESRNIVLASDPGTRGRAKGKVREELQELKKSMQNYEKTVHTDEGRNTFAALRTGVTEYEAFIEKIIGLEQANQLDIAGQLLQTDGARIGKIIENTLQEAQTIKIKQAGEKAASNQAAASQAIVVVSLIIIAGVLVAISLGVFIARAISRPIQNLVVAADSLAVGDVNVTSKTAIMKDEIGMLMQAFDRMITNIREQSLAVEKIAAGDLNVAVKIHSENDLLGKNLNKCIDNINRMIADVNLLSTAAVEGKLTTRADAEKHGGSYRQIVEGINHTLDMINEPIKEALAVLKEMASGNLRQQVEGDYRGDHAAIKNAMNETLDALNKAFADVKQVAEQVAAGAQQISASGEALSQGSTEQASSIEEITATMEQVAVQTKQNAVNANHANELANSSQEQAVQGNRQMQAMVTAMQEINESSVNISKIIKVIDEIAFQTNILALNAAVEAARAGQHGKGFAVVAEEVRNLAARSANAAKETTVMIEGSIQKVNAGTKIANDTAVALEGIVQEVAKAAALVDDIAGASNEQATAIAQVNQAIMQVSQVVQTNSSTAEESASASEELASQAEILRNNVSKFQLKQTGRNIQATEGLRPEVLRAIEIMLEKKKQGSKQEVRSGKNEAVLTAREKIVLDDSEFGKY